MPALNKKEMKLQREHRPNGSMFKILPSLRLAGNQLERYGFHPGEMVFVTYEQEKLTITTKRPEKEYLAEKEAERLLRMQEISNRKEFLD